MTVDVAVVGPEVDFVPDLTDWGRYRAAVWRLSLSVADSVVFVAVNGALILFATWLGVISFLFVGPLVQIVYPRVTRRLKVAIPSENGRPAESRTYLPSASTSSSPNFYESYSDHISEKKELDNVAARLVSPNGEEPNRRPPFDLDVARLFIHLSALVYENSDVIESTAKIWGLQYECLEQEPCAAYVFFSPLHHFAIVVFRGVSPFDLSELLIDSMLQKVRPDGHILPGMVHEGFFNLLSWSAESVPTTVIEDDAEEDLSARTACDVGELTRLLKEDVIPKMAIGSPAIWFTGHSLGAALATMVLSHLVHVKSPLITSSYVKGCYTFGSPKCGDTEFANVTAKRLTAARGESSHSFRQRLLTKYAFFRFTVVFYRVVNADDVMAALPIGGHTGGLASAMHAAYGEGKPITCHTDYKHVGVPVILHCDGLRVVGVDRDLEALIKNAVFWVGESVPFVTRFLSGRETLMAVAHRFFPFPHDHLPSQYDRHLV
ncbi:hypothetical protein HK101_005551 [Irineochytrium annulatum]|nr:hypothetical protein HK101_005551 [Irineochytrium annulatum]